VAAFGLQQGLQRRNLNLPVSILIEFREFQTQRIKLAARIRRDGRQTDYEQYGRNQRNKILELSAFHLDSAPVFLGGGQSGGKLWGLHKKSNRSRLSIMPDFKAKFQSSNGSLLPSR
jgi:hypothetical protein